MHFMRTLRGLRTSAAVLVVLMALAPAPARASEDLDWDAIGEELHTELLQSQLLRDFHDMWPEKFFNVTNGVTPRRFLLLSHPKLADRLPDG